MINTNNLCLIFLAILLTGCLQKPIAKFSTLNLNFGTKSSADTIRGRFEVKNIGEGNLIIKSVTPDCSCTVPTFTRSPIEPNAIGTINFEYVPKSTDSSSIHKELIVHLNAEKKIELLTIRGKINRL